jgi:dienelactone hydrolase
MTDAGIDWQMILYGGTGHSFTNRWVDAANIPGFAYAPAADERSWREMQHFLRETLGGSAPDPHSAHCGNASIASTIL